ncbi:MAG: ferrochelatase [Flavobacteriales bacterium]|nr:ferrochelatase [Flavobacteriales bacterium]
MEAKSRTGVVLINVGTPDSPAVGDVRRYLREFLGDGRVIDLPWLGRKLLVNGIIAPFRAPKSAKAYRKLWTPQGSPLIVHGNALVEAVQQRLGSSFKVVLAMRYQKPALPKVLDELLREGVGHVVLVPLFPQYSSAATGTALQEAMRILGTYTDVPSVSSVGPFHADEGYLNAFKQRIEQHKPETYDHVLFSFHGLPDRHIQRSHTTCSGAMQKDLDSTPVAGCPCEQGPYDKHPSCYKMQCHATARALAQRCGLSSDRWSVGFQSRLDQKWVTPFSDRLIEQYAKAGMKRLLVVSPAFVADCLETVIEIGDEYNELFQEHGGEHVQLVESLNAGPDWADALTRLVREAC